MEKQPLCKSPQTTHCSTFSLQNFLLPSSSVFSVSLATILKPLFSVVRAYLDRSIASRSTSNTITLHPLLLSKLYASTIIFFSDLLAHILCLLILFQDGLHACLGLSVFPCRQADIAPARSMFARSTNYRAAELSLFLGLVTFRQALTEICSPPLSTKNQTSVLAQAAVKMILHDHLAIQLSPATIQVASSTRLLRTSPLAHVPPAVTALSPYQFGCTFSRHHTEFALLQMTLSFTLACVASVVACTARIRT